MIDQKSISGVTLIIIMILCIALGMAPGYILGSKMLEKEKTQEAKDQGSNKTVETIEEQTNTNDQTNNTPSALSKYIDVSSECFNSNNCTKEFELSNGAKTITIKVVSNGAHYTIYKHNQELDSFIIEDPNFGKSKVNKIAFLDTEHLVIEMKNNAGITRYYYDSGNERVLTAFELPYNDKGRFDTEITDKEIFYFKQESTCDSEGKNRTVHKYRYTIKDKDEYSNDYMESFKIACAGQS